MIHAPKILRTNQGLGLPNTTRHIEKAEDGSTLLIEVWNEMPEGIWKQDDVIIAEPGFKWVSKWQVGKPYVIVKYYNGDDQLVGIYCDVCRPVKQTEDGLEYEDLYLDVWLAAGSKEPVILDENELREAFEQGFLNKADVGFARSVALVLVEKLKNNGPELQF